MSAPERPRITFLSGVLGRGGAERQLFYQTLALRRLGFSVRVLAFEDGAWGDELREAGVPLSVLHRSGAGPRLLALLKELRKNPADVIHGVHFYVSPHVCVAARVVGARAVCSVQSRLRDDLAKLPAPAGAVTLRLAQWIVANSRAALEEAKARGIPDRRLLYSPNAVDTQAYRPAAAKNGAVRPRLLAVGRLVDVKRFDRFIRVVAALRRRRDVEAVLVGEGPLRPQLEQLASSLGLERSDFRIETGSPDVAEHYRRATVFVQTSEAEGVPNVVLEAMASGLPVVATDVGGTAEAVEHGMTGLLAGDGGEAEIERQVERLLDAAHVAAQMGAAGRLRVERIYALDGLGERLEQMYSRITSAR